MLASFRTDSKARRGVVASQVAGVSRDLTLGRISQGTRNLLKAVTGLNRRNVKERLDDMLARVKQGDTDARDQLIETYMPFVLRVASQKVGRYLNPHTDEEVNVALMAFNEAIDAYNEDRGSFFAFSQTVIQRRLVDYFRKHREEPREVLFSDLQGDNDLSSNAGPLEHKAVSVWTVSQEDEARRQEIDEYQAALHKLGIKWSDLVRSAPKHRDSRRRAIELGCAVVAHPERQQPLLERGVLPVQALVKEFGVSRRLIERHRRYIIAVAILMSLDLPYLQEYVLERGRP